MNNQDKKIYDYQHSIGQRDDTMNAEMIENVKKVPELFEELCAAIAGAGFSKSKFTVNGLTAGDVSKSNPMGYLVAYDTLVTMMP